MNVDLESTIIQMAESVVINNELPDSISFTIRMETPICEMHDGERYFEGSDCSFYHMIFHTRSNYVKVYAVKSESMFYPDIEDVLKLVSNHDSGWRQDSWYDLRKIVREINNPELRLSIQNVEIFNLTTEIVPCSYEYTYRYNHHQKTIEKNNLN
jgi:hypothetical protein